MKRSVSRIPQKLWLGVMVFNCSHFKNYQTRYTKWWRNVGEHYVFNLSTFRWHHLKNKLLKSNHLQSSTFSGCCENISNVYKMILWEFFRRMILTNYICTGNNFRKRYYIISISRLESLLFRCDSHITFYTFIFLILWWSYSLTVLYFLNFWLL